MGVKITALQSSGALDGTEDIPVVQAGETVKTTAQDIADLFDVSAYTIKSGDTITFGLRGFVASGLITGGTSLGFLIPINKTITASSVSSITGTIVIRGIQGYVPDSSGVAMSAFDSVSYSITPSGIKVDCTWASAPANAVNNTPVSVACNNGFTITFA